MKSGDSRRAALDLERAVYSDSANLEPGCNCASISRLYNTRTSTHCEHRRSWIRTCCRSAVDWIRGASLRDARTYSCSDSSNLLDGEAEDRDFAFRRPCNLSYYYSVFAARLAIMVMLAILIGVLTILTWHFTTVYTTKSIQSLAYTLRYQLLQRPISRMWNLLNSTLDITMTQVNLCQNVVGQYSLPIYAAQQDELYSMMRNITWAVFTSRPTIKSIMIGYTNGKVQAFDRNLQKNQIFYYFSRPANNTSPGVLGVSSGIIAEAPGPFLQPVSSWPDATGGNSSIWYKQEVDPHSGQSTGLAIQIPSYNLSVAISESSQLKSGETYWHTAVDDFDNTPLLSSESPVRHPGTRSLLAVVRVTAALSSISQLMKDLSSMDNGSMYLTSKDGYVLATSTRAPILKNTTHGQQLMHATESSDPIIRTCATWLQENYGESELFEKDVHVENVHLGSDKFYIDSFSLNLTSLPLVGVIIMPRSFVMGQVDRRGHTTLAILISASICILVVGCVFIMILTSGVSREMKLRAELICHLDARRRAEASSNYKSQFLANMSHELRTPMAAVIGLLDILLCDEYLSAEQAAMVSQIRHCSNALLRLLNNILDLSKVESGKLVLEEADFDLGRELEGLVDVFSVQCMDHDLEIMLDLADDMPKIVRGDSARVVQIFANLIANSIKFTSTGHILLRGWCEPSSTSLQKGLSRRESFTLSSVKSSIGRGASSSRFQEADKIILWFEVEDTGCGIDPSKWETVFDSFVQADPSTTRTYGGTGLGLCIVRSLVNKMGGEIKVMRKEGPGTRIRLSLVFGQPSKEASLSVPQSPSSCLTFPLELRHAKVLLALKGGIGRTILSRWLTSNSVQVYESSDWFKATKMLYDMVQTDDFERDEDLLSCEDEHDLNGNPEGYIGKEDELQGSMASKSSEDHLELVDLDIKSLKPINFFAVVDAGLLSWNTDKWKSQLGLLNTFQKKGVTVLWLLNHDTSSTIKMNIRKMGYLMMANKPLYKSKFLQLFIPVLGSKAELGKVRAQSLSSGFELDVRDGLSPGSNMTFGLKHTSNEEQLTCLNPNSETEAAHEVETNSCLSVSDTLEDISESQGSDRSVNCLEFENDFAQHTKEAKSKVVLYPARDTCQNSSLDCGKSPTSILAIDGQKSSKRQSDANRFLSANHECNGFVNYSLMRQVSDATSQDSCQDNHPSKPSEKELFLNSSKNKSGETQMMAEPYGILAADRPEKQSGLEVSPRKDILEDSLNRLLSPSSPLMPLSTTAGSPILGGNNLQVSKQIISPTSLSGDSARPHAKNSLEPTLPRRISMPAPLLVQKTTLSEIGRQNALAGIRILLAEDTPVLQRVATIMLQKMGASVVAVGDGQQAVDALINSHRSFDSESAGISNSDSQLIHFDLVLMDCQMPRMDGYEATKAIRKAEEHTGWHTPIVALTAHAMSSDEAKCLQVGMDAYLTKPIDSKLMVSTILSLTKKRNE